MARYTLELTEKNPLTKKILRELKARHKIAERARREYHDKWTRAEERTLAYLPESSADAARRNQRDTSGKPVYTTIQVPYSYAVLMSSHTYWTSVFFGRNPIHQFSGLHGETERQVQAMEALIGYQVEVGEMPGPYYIWLYDAGKYGQGVLGHYWCRQKIHYGQLAEDEQGNLYQATMEIEGYQGNKVYNLSVWDSFPDPRVPLTRFQEGEFFIARRVLGWTQIVQRDDEGYYMKEAMGRLKKNVSEAKPRENGASALKKPEDVANFTWLGESSEKPDHPAAAVLFECYVNLIPRDWGLGSTSYPQQWCFTTNEDFSILLGATPVGYVHGKFPFDILEMEIEGYGLYNRGIPEIVEPIQHTMDWLLNTHFYNVRASLNNQFLMDPSRVVVKDVKNSGPGFIWRLRPEAYGSDLSKVFMQIPVQDVTKSHMIDFQNMFGIGEKALGVNEQIMGAFSSGGRKTATEVRTSTGFGVNRQKTICEYMSATGFSPHGVKLVQTSQQMYDGMQKFKIVGDLALEAGEDFIDVSPADISGYFMPSPVDGTLPIDRMAQANLWKEIFANFRLMPPQIMMQYDVSRMFGWMAQLAGLKNINQFKVQVLPPGVAPTGMPQPVRQLPAPSPSSSGVGPGNSASGQTGLDNLIPTEDLSSVP